MSEHFRRLGSDELRKAVEEAEDYAKSVAPEVVKELRERIIVAYSSSGDIPAWTFYWIIKEVAPQAPIEIHSSDAVAFHVLAYRRRRGGEEHEIATDTTIFAFVGPGGENQFMFLRDASVHTGAGLVVVTSGLPPVLEQRLGPEPLLVEPPSPYPLSATILAARLAALIVDKLAQERHIRVERVDFETGDVKSVVDELLGKHGEEASRILSGEFRVLVHTPTLTGPALLASRLSGIVRKPVQEYLAEYALGWRPESLAIMYTTADEDVIREVRFKAMVSGMRFTELRLATDPVTAPIYATILFYHGGNTR